MIDLLAIALLCLIYRKGVRAIAAYHNRAQIWRDADAKQRERAVRDECAWRVILRLSGAVGLGIGAFMVASPGLAAMWALVAVRLLT